MELLSQPSGTVSRAWLSIDPKGALESLQYLVSGHLSMGIRVWKKTTFSILSNKKHPSLLLSLDLF